MDETTQLESKLLLHNTIDDWRFSFCFAFTLKHYPIERRSDFLLWTLERRFRSIESDIRTRIYSFPFHFDVINCIYCVVRVVEAKAYMSEMISLPLLL